MRPQHDLIALYRHVLRAGDVRLARRLGAALLLDPRYRSLAMAELERLPRAGLRHESPGGRLLDGLIDHLGEVGAR